MWLTKQKVALAVLLTVGMIGGVGRLAHRALADKPAKPAAADDKKTSDKKTKPAAAPTVRGTVASVDAEKKTIAVNVPKNDGTKDVEEKTFTVAADGKVTLDEPAEKGKAQPTGKLGDLTAGTHVTVRLAADRKSAVAILARGPTLHAVVESTDTDKNTLTIRYKTEQGPEDLTLALAKGAKIAMTDALTKKDKVKLAKLADLTAETGVNVHLSVDRKRAVGISVRGDSLFGVFKSADEANNTITVTVKEDGNLVDKELGLLKNARVEGAKLKDLQAGQKVVLTLSVFDKAKVAVVHALADE